MADTLNGMVRDSNQQPVQIGNTIQTNDAAASPVTSPLTLTGSTQAITIPFYAMELVLYPVAHNLQVSEKANMSQYDLIVAGSKESIPVARASIIYVSGTTSDTLYFRFTVV